MAQGQPCECRGPGLRCGTSGYNYGCKCDYCRAANRKRVQTYRRKRKDRPVPSTIKHGKTARPRNSTLARSPEPQADPLLAALFRHLPPKDQGLSKAGRDDFVAALEAAFPLVYGEDP